MVERVFVAGIPVRDELILELARMVEPERLAERKVSNLRTLVSGVLITLGLSV